MTKKRVLAYIIDFVILLLFSYIITTLLTDNQINLLNIENTKLMEQYFLNKINLTTYINKYSILVSEIDKQKLLINISILIYMIIYYIIIPYITKGKTLGKSILKIKITKQNIQIKDYIIRSFIINGTLYLLTLIMINIILPPVSYFITVTFLSIIQIIMVITSYFMVLYKGKGLEDIITSSSVIDEVKK